jgi:membrane protein
MRIPGLRGLSLKAVGKRLLGEISEDDCAGQAAQLAYSFLFSLFPLLLFLVALIGFLPIPDLFGKMMDMAAGLLPPEALSLVRDNIATITAERKGGLLSVGAVVALWGASAGFRAIMNALNRAYDVEEGRPWWKVYGISVLATLGLAALAVAAFALLIFGPQIGEAIAGLVGLGQVFQVVWAILRWPIAIALLGLVVAVIYYIAPDVEQDWKWVTPGSVLAVVGWVIASALFSLYVQNFGSYDKTYGSLGAVIVLLLWLYMTGFMLLVGGEANAVIEHLAPEGKRPGDKTMGVKEGEPAAGRPELTLVRGQRAAAAASYGAGRTGPAPAVEPDLPPEGDRRRGERRQGERRRDHLTLVRREGEAPSGPRPAGRDGAGARSTRALVGDVVEETRRFVRLQARLAAVEVRIAGRRVVTGAGLAAAGGAVALVGLLYVLGGLVFLLGGVLPLWGAAFVVAAVVLMVSAAAVRLGLGALRRRHAGEDAARAAGPARGRVGG